MIGAYTRKTGKDEAEVRSWLTSGEDRWYTSDEALEAGLADKITDAELDSEATARLAKAPMAIRSMAVAAFKAVKIPTLEDKKMTVQTDKTEAVVAPVAALNAEDVQAKAVADAVAAVRVQIEAEAQAKVDAAVAQVAEINARLNAEVEAKELRDVTAEVASTYANLAVKAEEFAPALRAIRKAAPEAAVAVEAALKSANALLKDPKAAQMEAVGNAVATEAENESPYATVDRLAKVEMQADPKLTAVQARNIVYNKNRNLIDAMRAVKD